MRVSIVKKIINPVEPNYLSGQINRIIKHTGILDDLYCTALLIEQNQTKICLLSYDLLQFDESLSRKIRNHVASNLRIPIENIFTIPSHTHAAPEVLKDGLFGIKTSSVVSNTYLQQVILASIEVSAKANTQLQNVSVEYAEHCIEGYYGNRNNKDKLSDKSIRFLCFKQSNKLVGIFVNLACHPTILGPQNTQISADLIGALRKGIEDKYHCPVFISNGAEGDISNRHYRVSNDEIELIRSSKGILDQLPSKLDGRMLIINEIVNYSKKFRLRCFNDNQRIQDAITENNRKILNNDNPDVLKLLNATNTVLCHRLNQEVEAELTITYSILDLESILLITIPLELFSSLYILLKEAIDIPVIILGLTNVSHGYCVDQASFEHTYEGLTSLFIKGEGERFINVLIDEVKQISRK